MESPLPTPSGQQQGRLEVLQAGTGPRWGWAEGTPREGPCQGPCGDREPELRAGGCRWLHGAGLTPNICRRSGSRNRKGMLETCNLLGCCLSVLSEECSCWLSVCAASSVCCGSTSTSSAPRLLGGPCPLIPCLALQPPGAPPAPWSLIPGQHRASLLGLSKHLVLSWGPHSREGAERVLVLPCELGDAGGQFCGPQHHPMSSTRPTNSTREERLGEGGQETHGDPASTAWLHAQGPAPQHACVPRAGGREGQTPHTRLRWPGWEVLSSALSPRAALQPHN